MFGLRQSLLRRKSCLTFEISNASILHFNQIFFILLSSFKNDSILLSINGGAILLLRFEHISKIYNGETKAVNDLSLHIKKGEFICLIGPSGCGKTTTMKMINRLIEPSSGNIFINRSEEHTSELQSRVQLVYRHLLDKIYTQYNSIIYY